MAAQHAGFYFPIISFGGQAFNLEKKRLSRDLITVFQYIKGGYKEDGSSIFTGSHMEKAVGTSCVGRGFILVKERKYFTVRTVNH